MLLSFISLRYLHSPIMLTPPIVTEIQGTSEEVAKDKCRRAAEIIQGPCITEDTGLVFNAMGDLPGPYIKWFLGSLGLDGLNKMLVGFEDKTAYASCTFAYSAGPGSEPILFEGRTSVCRWIIADLARIHSPTCHL
jgi:inosine triphosphate pyrophosphatase